MAKFVFSSNISDQADKNLILTLLEDAEDVGCFSDFTAVFLNEVEKEDIVEKVKRLTGAVALIVPVGVELNDSVKREIELAQKQEIEIRYLSHWDKADLENLKNEIEDSIFRGNRDVFDCDDEF